MEREKEEGNEACSKRTGFTGVRTLFKEIPSVPRRVFSS